MFYFELCPVQGIRHVKDSTVGVATLIQTETDLAHLYIESFGDFDVNASEGSDEDEQDVELPIFMCTKEVAKDLNLNLNKTKW